ncbi:hypothetical protein VOI54_06690 [Tamlana sp. 2201CG12-4]|uniref:hypothetical protein n=1 Tax=Tamlana sp. 2201CG12-4 TaxID=3112582 RepID=UPI002DBCB266|nr:hypothetical protein [Tamlana sp. 2201CG12-4]MEC3906699.1 hypothetical protein [Tamlana sp. 2201CG12-4]
MLIKLSIVTGAFYFIYYKLVDSTELKYTDFIDFIAKNNIFTIANLVFLVFLTSFNWFFEILKWKTLVGFIKTISFKNALEQSLSSLTASLFTPNRIGEYGVKAMYYAVNLRKRIVFINLINNLLQMAITTILGIIGLYFFILEYKLNINLFKHFHFLLILLITIGGIGILAPRKNISVKGVSLEKIKRFLTSYPKHLLIKGFIYALIRYFIFSFQFYYLLKLFYVDMGYFNTMVVVSSMYLMASVLPSILLFDVVIKGSIGVYLFSIAGVDQFTSLSVVTIMWLFNFALPSLFGSYYVLNYSYPKTKRFV